MILKENSDGNEAEYKATLPLPDEKYAIPAQAAVSPAMNSVNALPCDFVAAITALLELRSEFRMQTALAQRSTAIAPVDCYIVPAAGL